MMRRTLIYEGFQVATALNGPEALAQMQVEAPDLIVLNWMMPDYILRESTDLYRC